MRRIRQAISLGTFAAFKHDFLQQLSLKAFTS
jgi:queuine/archaeosine tRNA-ribosyltransferase